MSIAEVAKRSRDVFFENDGGTDGKSLTRSGTTPSWNISIYPLGINGQKDSYFNLFPTLLEYIRTLEYWNTPNFFLVKKVLKASCSWKKRLMELSLEDSIL